MKPPGELPNPFDSDVVVNPNQATAVDVAAIHRPSFEACCSEYEKVAAGGGSRSVLFSGQAGCGKTHLLSRFRRWLGGGMDGRPSRPPAAFVAVRMETAPTQVWRHLRRRFAGCLLEVLPEGSTALDAILDRYAERQGQHDLPSAFDRAPGDLTLEAMRVLEHFAAARHRRLCRAWLQGESLAEADRAALGLGDAGGEDLDEESGESAARRLVVSLVHLCKPDPVVFCFDQIEALGLATGANSFGLFTRLGATLVDETANSLVVSSVLAQFVADLRIQASDYARIAKVALDLHALDWSLGRLLIEARLDALADLAPHRPNAGVAPLRESDLRKVFAGPSPQCAARKLIHEAKRLFAAWQGAGDAPRVPLGKFLESALDVLRERSAVRSDPARMDEILAHGLPAAAKLARFPLARTDRPKIDFEAGDPAAPVLVALCNEPHARAVYYRLVRLREAVGQDKLDRLCLVRDPRRPVARTAKAKAHQELASLTERGARLVRPDPEAVAAIDAIRALLSQATSGELSHDGETVEAGQVQAWLETNLPASVTSLIDDLCAGASIIDLDPLIELLRARKIVAVEEAARELGWPVSQVVEYARANPGLAGLVEGRTAVVFHVVAALDGGADAGS